MWDNLLTVLITGIVTLTGVVLTQSRADKRDRERWDRERAHEREVWSRDDAARSYDQRREAYVTFLNEFMIMLDRVVLSQRPNEPEFSEDVFDPLYRLLPVVDVFGTRAAHKHATNAYFSLVEMCFGSLSSARRPDIDDVMIAKDTFVDQTRRDLHVSDE